MAGTGAAIRLPFHSQRVTGGQMRAIAEELELAMDSKYKYTLKRRQN